MLPPRAAYASTLLLPKLQYLTLNTSSAVFRILRSLLPLLTLFLGFAPQAEGQVLSSSKYTTASYTLTHRAGHWYDTDWRGSYTAGNSTTDTFDETNPMTTAPEGTVQNTHVYVDTIYMQKGKTAELNLPILWKNTDTTPAASAYIRWYNYRTGGTFSYTSNGSSYDLLYPQNSPTMYRDANNGYFAGKLFGGGVVDDFSRFKFYYPTDAEATSNGFNSTSNNNDDYIIACDISPYTDGSLSGSNLIEPSLSQRVIFYVSGMSNNESDLSKSSENFWNFINACRTADATTGQTNSSLAVDDPNKKYYVTYDIDFPFTRFDERASYEMVVLNKSVDHYFAPGATQDQLTVTLRDNTNSSKSSGIKLIDDKGNEVNTYTKSATKSDTSPRCIRFSYPVTNADGTEEVNNENATASIYVTNSKGDGLVRFNLTFTKGQRLLTQSEVNSIEKGEVPTTATDIVVSDYAKRVPSYLEQNYQLVTKLDMNYNSAAESLAGVKADRQNQSMANEWCRTGTGVYPFPMGWSYSSYGFMDGSNVWEGHSSSSSTGNFVAEWGEYSFVNKYIFDNRTNKTDFPIATTLPNGDVMQTATLDNATNYYSPTNYFLYVDAAADPGIIARIPFRENLCAGAELFMTGWVKNATDQNKDNVDAAILMSIVAARVDANGNELETRVISRHSTGMFPHTALCSRYGGASSTRAVFTSTATEEWLQFFYSFTMPQIPFSNLGADESVSYYLELQNNAASSSGADYYLDDISIYMANPEVKVTQVTPTCSSTDTRMQIRLDYDMTISRFGLQDKENLDEANRVDVDFVLIDSLEWATGAAEINARTDLNDYDGQLNDTLAIFFKTCRVNFALLKDTVVDGNATIVPSQLQPRHTLVFYNSYAAMQADPDKYQYDDNMRGYNSAYTPEATETLKSPYPRWRIIEEGGKRYLVTDISVGDGNKSKMQAGRTYILAMSSSYDASASTTEGNASESEQVSVYDAFVDPCGYRGAFTPQGSIILQTTGEIVTPDMSFCAGQVNNFTAKLRIYNNGVQVDIADGYFDWFFNDEAIFNAPNEDYGGVTLKDALFQLREIYPNLTLTQLDTLHAVKKGTNVLTEDMIGLIRYYTEQESTEFLNPMLILHEQAANIRISLANGEIVVYPSPMELSGTNMACFDPIAISFTVEGTAPEIHLGYDGENYASSVQAALRLGLDQIRAHNSNSNPMILPLRGVTYSGTGTENVDHLGIIRSTTDPTTGLITGSDLPQVFLLGTDDPAYVLNTGQYSNPIGVVDRLFATSDAARASSNTLQIHFNDSFKPHEGFTYNVKIWFEEKDSKDSSVVTTSGATTSVCYGAVVIPIKVVPKYLRWVGSSTDNYNNDDFWKRSLSAELYKQDYDDYNDVLEASKQETASQNYHCKGFVPLNFSRVTIPDSAALQLYQAAAKTAGGSILNLVPPTASGILSATKQIEYDLVYNDNRASSTSPHTVTYYTNTVREVHLRPAAEVLRAEYLNYERAWVDVKLPTAEWSLVSTPFAKTYSGEFFTTTNNGLQETELFQPITFNTTDYDRFAPAVYLRSYVGASALRLESASDAVGTSMALTGHWSGVYNKVNRELAIGEAFSVKPVRGNATEAVGDSVIIRLPKADDFYSYYYDNSNAASNTTATTKDETNGTNRYSLVAYDDILPTKTSTSLNAFTTPLTAELEEEPAASLADAEKWYILGNPFVCHLNLQKFFAANPAFSSLTYRTANGEAAEVTADALIPPLSAFYAKLADGQTAAPATLTFTADMEALPTSTSSSAANAVRGLRLTALAGGHKSRALVLTAADAKADYLAGEDCEVFVPDADEQPCPVVYTVAGNVATAVNRTPSVVNLPIGLIGADGEEVSVRFDYDSLGDENSFSIIQNQSKNSNQSVLSNQLKSSNQSVSSTASSLSVSSALTLYDALLATTTPIERGSVVTLAAGVHGRYFLNAGTSTAAAPALTIYSAARRLVVSSTAEALTRVEVYTPDGRCVLTATPAARTFTTNLPAGIYFVRAATTTAQSRAKVRL